MREQGGKADLLDFGQIMPLRRTYTHLQATRACATADRRDSQRHRQRPTNMIDFSEEQIAARELRNTAYHEAGHKMLYERFGGAGDAVVWKNESGNPDESSWLGQFRPRTCPEVMRKVALNHGFAAPELPANWKMLVGMAGMLAEEILSGETDDTGAMADPLFCRISFGEASASDLALMGGHCPATCDRRTAQPRSSGSLPS
ncbi:hypothetical protein [Burkholderia sp. BCC0801]|uniref:hypothetical protein n=2 Tax=unclassified Burkholderia TaxID=2613784 RepID=UPI001FC85BEC|nr:hypothetical protein [Burkholderia sp. BCC0801]